MKFKFNKIAILGMGLMGGSLGRILLRNKIAREVIGWGRNIKRLKKAFFKKAATKITTDLQEAVNDADIVLISLPVLLIPEYFKKIYHHLKKDCIVTDMGSVKEKIVKEIKKYDRKNFFIGSHPMVGSEKTGIDNIRDDLYKNGVCIITPDIKTNKKKLKILKSFWKKIGMQIVLLNPLEHDKYVSGISHFPHLLAFILTLIEEPNIIKRKKIIGKGFLDTTRIAASGEEIWSDILVANKSNILKEIENFKRKLNLFEILLKNDDKSRIKKLLKKAKLLREQLQ